ncbi:MAG: hypothetical protein A2Y17_00100 [Clostridiales bacterium GWF2_38_85]|nr:MAG: hypothetical protein A2Y17_00100 [Clostridiales bacterium GWF2_38_85]HBL83971.1 hypothetical protein [Clostridiales bacterium]
MEQDIKKQFIYALLRFKKVGMTYSNGNDIRMSEVFVMKNIEKNSNCSNANINVSDIQNDLHITKPAVSQMLSNLEKKGYISREIDTKDRRKISVIITPEGQKILKQSCDNTDRMLGKLVERFGVDNTKQLTELFTKLVDIFEDLKLEASQAEIKGEN